MLINHLKNNHCLDIYLALDMPLLTMKICKHWNLKVGILYEYWSLIFFNEKLFNATELLCLTLIASIYFLKFPNLPKYILI